MANISFSDGGLIYPPRWGDMPYYVPNGVVNAIQYVTIGPVDAAAEQIAMIGPVYWSGGVKKLMSSAGSKIHFKTSTIVWTAASVGTFGLQRVDAVNGPPIRPDGVFIVGRTVTATSAGFSMATDTWTSATMTSGAGQSITQGELYAFVFTLSSRVSTDAVNLSGIKSSNQFDIPVCNNQTGGAWVTTPTGYPVAILEADDGTLGWFAGSINPSSVTAVSLSSASGVVDEMGLIFSLPFTGVIDQISWHARCASSVADCKIVLYSSPNTTPATVTSITWLGQNSTATGNNVIVTLPLKGKITLTSSTTYGLMVLATATTAITCYSMQFANEAYRKTWAGGQQSSVGRRLSSGAGAFSVVNTEVPSGFSVRVQEIQGLNTTVTATTTITTTITVGGGGLRIHPGMDGGLRG